MAKRTLSRRGFLKRGTGAALAPMIVPSKVFGANEKIAIAYIGTGRRGGQLTGFPPKHAVCVALADVNMRRLEDWKKRRPFRDCQLYQDYRELLARDDIDGVIVATPDHWHALHSIHAMEAGKDVYVEKPMTLTIREGRLMTEAARKHKRICQVGSQQRSTAANREGCELIRNGRIGKVHTVHAANFPGPWECGLGEEPVPAHLNWDMWCGPTEPRAFHPLLYLPRAGGDRFNHSAGWISFRPYSGGEVTGWGAHGLDQIQWALGMDETGPVTVEPLLDRVPPDDGVHKGPHCEVRFTYANGVVVILDGKGGGGGGFFEGDEGTLRLDRGKYAASKGVDTSPVGEDGDQLYDSFKKTLAEEKTDDTRRHIGNWLWAMRTREQCAADVEIGHRSTVVCHLANIARWTERKLVWDPEKERFIDDDDANAYLDRKRRAPWTLS